jgi:hypothetical protein
MHNLFKGDALEFYSAYIFYGVETLGNKFYLSRETLRLSLSLCTGTFWYTQQLYFQHTLRLYISHGTDTIMKRYATERTEIPFGPFDVCIWVSSFLIQDSPVEGTSLQSPIRGILTEPLN